VTYVGVSPWIIASPLAISAEMHILAYKLSVRGLSRSFGPGRYRLEGLNVQKFRVLS
jgi:hypothetical protein